MKNDTIAAFKATCEKAKKDKEFARKILIRAGIINKDGTLAEPYTKEPEYPQRMKV